MRTRRLFFGIGLTLIGGAAGWMLFDSQRPPLQAEFVSVSREVSEGEAPLVSLRYRLRDNVGQGYRLIGANFC